MTVNYREAYGLYACYVEDGAEAVLLAAERYDTSRNP